MSERPYEYPNGWWIEDEDGNPAPYPLPGPDVPMVEAVERTTGRKLSGYYIRVLDVTPGCTQQQEYAFFRKHMHHYIAFKGFSDWNMPAQLRLEEVDPEKWEIRTIIMGNR